jgi:hypothetical protein
VVALSLRDALLFCAVVAGAGWAALAAVLASFAEGYDTPALRAAAALLGREPARR